MYKYEITTDVTSVNNRKVDGISIECQDGTFIDLDYDKLQKIKDSIRILNIETMMFYVLDNTDNDEMIRYANGVLDRSNASEMIKIAHAWDARKNKLITGEVELEFMENLMKCKEKGEK